jgi:hypothetical protein
MTRVIDRLRVRCSEAPVPKHPDMFGSFPSAAAGERCANLMTSRTIAQALLFSDDGSLSVHLLPLPESQVTSWVQM